MNIKMRNKKSLVLLACLYLGASSAFALDPSTDFMQNGSTGTSPVKSGNTTTFNQNRNIDTYRWNKFNLAQDEVARFNFTNANSTAINYLTPGADPSTIMGRIEGTKNGNVFLFNPNGITFGAGASVNNVNTFMTSTNVFKEVDGTGNITFSEPLNKTKLTVDELTVNNATNVHFVAPSVAITSLKYGTQKPVSMSVRAIGCGNYSTTNNLFSNTLASSGTLPNGAIIDLGANLDAHNINVEAKVKSNKSESVSLRGNINSYKIDGTTGQIYILASNENADTNAAVNVVQSGIISGENLTCVISGSNYNYTQDGNIDINNIETSTGRKRFALLFFNNYVQNKDINFKGELYQIKGNSFTQNGKIIIKDLDNSGSKCLITADKLTLNNELFITSNSSLIKGNSKLDITAKANIHSTSEFGLNIFSKNISIGQGKAEDTCVISTSLLNDLLSKNKRVIFYSDNDLSVNEKVEYSADTALSLCAARNLQINKNISLSSGNLFLAGNARPDGDYNGFVNPELRQEGKGTIIFDQGTTISTKSLYLSIGESSYNFPKALPGDLTINNTINAELFTISMENSLPCSLNITGNVTTNEINVYADNATINLVSGNFSAPKLDLKASDLTVGDEMTVSKQVEFLRYNQKSANNINSQTVKTIINKLHPAELILQTAENIIVNGINFTGIKLGINTLKNVIISSTGALNLDSASAQNANLTSNGNIDINGNNIYIGDFFVCSARGSGNLNINSALQIEGDIKLSSNETIKLLGSLSGKNLSLIGKSIQVKDTFIANLDATETVGIKVNSQDTVLNCDPSNNILNLSFNDGSRFDNFTINLNTKKIDINLENKSATVMSYEGKNDLLNIKANNINIESNISTTGSISARANSSLKIKGNIAADKSLDLYGFSIENTQPEKTPVSLIGMEETNIKTTTQNIFLNDKDTIRLDENNDNVGDNVFKVGTTTTLTLNSNNTISTNSALTFNELKKLSLIASTVELKNILSVSAGDINIQTTTLNLAGCNSILAKDNLVLDASNIMSNANCSLTSNNQLIFKTETSDLTLDTDIRIKLNNSVWGFKINQSNDLALETGAGKSITLNLDFIVSKVLFKAPTINLIRGVIITQDLSLITDNLTLSNFQPKVGTVLFSKFSTDQSINTADVSNIITKFNPANLTIGTTGFRGNIDVQNIDLSNVLLNLNSQNNTTIKSTGNLNLNQISCSNGDLQAKNDIIITNSGFIDNSTLKLTSESGNIKTNDGDTINIKTSSLNLMASNGNVKLDILCTSPDVSDSSLKDITLEVQAKDIDISATGSMLLTKVSATNNANIKADSIWNYGELVATKLNLNANYIKLIVEGEIKVESLGLTTDKLIITQPDTKVAIKNLNYSTITLEQSIDDSVLETIFDTFTPENLTLGSDTYGGGIDTASYFEFGNTKLVLNTSGSSNLKAFNNINISGKSKTGLDIISFAGDITIGGNLISESGITLTTLGTNAGIKTDGNVDIAADYGLMLKTKGDLNINASSALYIATANCENANITTAEDLKINNISGNNINLTAKTKNVAIGNLLGTDINITATDGDIIFGIDTVTPSENLCAGQKLNLNAKGRISCNSSLYLGGFKNIFAKAEEVRLNSKNDINVASLTGSSTSLEAFRDINILGLIDSSNALYLDANKISSMQYDAKGNDYTINSQNIRMTADVLNFKNLKNNFIDNFSNSFRPKSNVNSITDNMLKNLSDTFDRNFLLGGLNYWGNIGTISDVKTNFKAISLETGGDIAINNIGDLAIYSLVVNDDGCKNISIKSDKSLSICDMPTESLKDSTIKITAGETLILGTDILGKDVDIKAKELSVFEAPKFAKTDVPQEIEITGTESTKITLGSQDMKLTKTADGSLLSLSKSQSTLDTAEDSDLTIRVGKTANLTADAGDNNDLLIDQDYVNTDLKTLTMGGKNIKTTAADTKVNILDAIGSKIALIWRGKASPHVTNDKSRWSSDFKKEAVLIADDFGTANTSLDISTTNADLLYAKDINYSPKPAPGERISLNAQNSFVVMAEPVPGPTPDPKATGGGSSSTGAIVGGTVGGTAAAGAAAIGVSHFGLLPGLLLGMASPIQYDETMLDQVINNKCQHPLLMRNIDCVFQVDDPSKLDPDKIGSVTFIPDSCITNGTYDVLKIKIPQKLVCCKKPITITITEKSCPFKVTKNTPDLNFNVFNKVNDDKLSSIYKSRKFMKKSTIDKYGIQENHVVVRESEGIVQKTITICPQDLCKELSLIVNYAKDGHIPKKGCKNLEKQNYSLVVQFCEKK